MKWITRARPKTDRIACPWLIRRFIDPAAEIIYVPADDVLATAEREGGHSFDAPGAEFTHRPAPDGQGEWCTFETLIAEHHLDDPPLARLARIVHAAGSRRSWHRGHRARYRLPAWLRVVRAILPGTGHLGLRRPDRHRRLHAA